MPEENTQPEVNVSEDSLNALSAVGQFIGKDNANKAVTNIHNVNSGQELVKEPAPAAGPKGESGGPGTVGVAPAAAPIVAPPAGEGKTGPDNVAPAAPAPAIAGAAAAAAPPAAAPALIRPGIRAASKGNAISPPFVFS